ncbi:hypothetical protein [Phytomonospora endophytica]|uniref:Uncharacterized protein n=1 Tax=Phytomonospora endophytica TaxID=714109 RepID=A0A841FPE8_9ACTN|nr:hypothetical protein [Phytomonospora endophytica]MBB6035432.1 hypothetical protein [Phytomonospora endophytica]GIG63816.1 hypothetical protein Pen01_01110 [Phytomonospora endophytica]
MTTCTGLADPPDDRSAGDGFWPWHLFAPWHAEIRFGEDAPAVRAVGPVHRHRVPEPSRSRE